MHLFKTTRGNIVSFNNRYYLLAQDWDEIINRDNLHDHLKNASGSSALMSDSDVQEALTHHLLPPIGSQEVWAAGVTYLRSRDARMEESEDSGAADCYQRVYEALRPELFFKSLPHRVRGHNQSVNIRTDSTWDVPEPELTLYINSSGNIQAYTIGNDMSSRSIEGENPLYLPQAKMYEGSAAIGPCLYIPAAPVALTTVIHMNIYRGDKKMFDDSTTLQNMKRSLTELVAWLYKAMDFEYGAFLMTGTCVVPDNSFTLQEHDVVNITIDNIGTLTNTISSR
ncbi:fumarylacetoacetate hydrolase family protein [Panacibacter sp. DH6]|uniref:Fumarylacetoacetate hydrolase family protein n=1 Tax=Panacibacter microcysteis TaxID=2793269 RepID=A0A931GZU7_9BACT|nr:fumarylacetoacetate hydrolase family protein [Panacibacter microcysteis]MBG9378394.1 fumarylacetoacetate hydrolase family protein [Panacibacter microcysteis]